MAGGHGLLIGVPGLAKTKLVETLGTVFGLTAHRVQFTPDLMPSDILGSEVMDIATDGTRGFRFVQGPVFTQLLMADEINRASPRTQSALLQAMQEHHVTVAGVRHDLPAPFHVLATQNPLEQEGTYPLPEAQLDRFLLQIDVLYPGSRCRAAHALRDHRRQRGARRAGARREPACAPSSCSSGACRSANRWSRRSSTSSARRGPTNAETKLATAIAWGPGPRASQALMLACRARALIDGRYAPSLDDVIALAEPVLQHRMALSFAARADGITVRDVIAELKAKIS